jgi:hypothetical protein
MEKYLNFFKAWLSKFSNYSLIGSHPTYHFHIAFVLRSSADMPLFCGEDLNFGRTFKIFFTGSFTLV